MTCRTCSIIAICRKKTKNKITNNKHPLCMMVCIADVFIAGYCLYVFYGCIFVTSATAF